MKEAKRVETPNHRTRKGIKDERKELIKRTRDKILNVSRAIRIAAGRCIVCGDEIKNNQTFSVLPKDRNCKEDRLYHIRTCGPGSNNWKAFKANGKKAPDNSLLKAQLSFDWEATSKQKKPA